MSILGDILSGAKKIGGYAVEFGKGLWAAVSGAVGLTLGWLAIGAYYIWLWARNRNKRRVSLTSCMIDIIEHLFHGDVVLSDVEIVVNASGIANARATTHGHTIYWRGSFDEFERFHLLLHELHHTQQYSDWGYVTFATRYLQEAVYYASHDAMPIERSAVAFADAHVNRDSDRNGNDTEIERKYRRNCLGVVSGSRGAEELPDDWTMLLGLV